jgi:hypothetical protein
MSDGRSASAGKVKSLTSRKSQKELTEAERQGFGPRYIGALLANLNTELNEIWEDYVAINFYLLEVHRQIKSKTLGRVIVPRLVSKPRMQPLGASAIYGIISRIRATTSGRHAFIDAVGIFEQFMSMLVFKVYLDFPRKLNCGWGRRSASMINT